MANVGTLEARAVLTGGRETSSGLDAISKSADKAAKSAENLNNRWTASGAAASRFNSSARTMNGSLSGIGRESEAVATRLKGLETIFAGFGGAAMGLGLIQMADQFNLLQKRTELMAGSVSLGSAAFGGLYKTANEVGQSIDSVVGMFTRLNGIVLQNGYTQQTTLAMVSTLSKALAVQGVSAREGAASIQQFGQALASGKLAGDEFRSMMENAPYIMQQFAKNIEGANGKMGVTVGELRKMSMEGKLTTDVLIVASERMAGKISSDFEQIPLTAARGFEAMRNSFKQQLDVMNDSSGATKLMGQAAMVAADNMGTLFNVAAGFAALKVASVLGGIAQANLNTAKSAVVAGVSARQMAKDNVTSAQASVVDTLAKKAQADAILRAAQTTAAMGGGTAKLASAQAASTAATAAHTAATTTLTAAQARLNAIVGMGATAMRTAGVAMAALGGPIGVLMLAIGGLVAYWDDLAAAAGNAAAQQRNAVAAGNKNISRAGMGDVGGVAESLTEYKRAEKDIKEREKALTETKARLDKIVNSGRKDEAGVAARNLAKKQLGELENDLNIAKVTFDKARQTVIESKNAYVEATNKTKAGKKPTAALSPEELGLASKNVNAAFDPRVQYEKRVKEEAAKVVASQGVKKGDAGYNALIAQAESSYKKFNPFKEDVKAGKEADKLAAKQGKLADAYATRIREEMDIKAALTQENYALAKSESEYADAKARNKDLADLKGMDVSADSENGKAFLALRQANREAAQDADRAREQYKEQAKAVDDLAKAYADSYVALQGYNREQKMALDTKDMTEYQKSIYAVKMAMEELNEVRTKQIFGSDTDYKAAQNAAQDKVNKAQAGVGLAGVASLKETQDYTKTLPANLTDAAIAEENKRYADKLEALGLHGEGMLTLTEEQNAALEAEAVRHKTVIDGLNRNQYNGELTAFASFGDSMGNLIGNMNANRAKEDKKALGLQKAFALSSAMISMYMGISKGLEKGGALGYIEAAGAAAAGMANVANIKSISASRGADLPNQVTNATLHPKEMVLPRQLADKVRGLSDVNGMIKNGDLGSGKGDGAVTIINQTSGRVDSVQETRLPNGERALIIREAQDQMVASLSDPNSRMSKAMSRNYNTQRSR